MRETVPSSRLATHTEPPPAVDRAGAAADRVLGGDAAAVRIDQPDCVLVDAGEAVGLEHADDPERRDAGEQRARRRPPATRASAAAAARAPHGLRLGRRGQVERRVLREDLLVQPLQLGARLDADLLDERRARGAVGLQRLRLAARRGRARASAGRAGARAAGARRRARRARRSARRGGRPPGRRRSPSRSRAAAAPRGGGSRPRRTARRPGRRAARPATAPAPRAAATPPAGAPRAPRRPRRRRAAAHSRDRGSRFEPPSPSSTRRRCET